MLQSKTLRNLIKINMSSVIKLSSLMHDRECLVDALKENNETVNTQGTKIIVTSQHQYRDTEFILTNTGYQLNTDSHNTVVRNPDWLKKINSSYEKLYTIKLEKLAEAERQRIEAERKKYVAEQELKIKEKAKKLGYKVEKRVEKDNKIQLVLVKRVL